MPFSSIIQQFHVSRINVVNLRSLIISKELHFQLPYHCASCCIISVHYLPLKSSKTTLPKSRNRILPTIRLPEAGKSNKKQECQRKNELILQGVPQLQSIYFCIKKMKSPDSRAFWVSKIGLITNFFDVIRSQPFPRSPSQTLRNKPWSSYFLFPGYKSFRLIRKHPFTHSTTPANKYPQKTGLQ